jgi:putative intracellular protease/amidase
MPIASARYIIIARADSAQLVNDTVREIDPTSTGDNVTVPLRSVASGTTAVVAVGGSWAMDETTSQALRAAFRDAGWRPRPSAAELTVHVDGALPAADFLSGNRVCLFDGLSVTFPAALDSLGLATMPPAV